MQTVEGRYRFKGNRTSSIIATEIKKSQWFLPEIYNRTTERYGTDTPNSPK